MNIVLNAGTCVNQFASGSKHDIPGFEQPNGISDQSACPVYVKYNVDYVYVKYGESTRPRLCEI